MTYRKLVAVIGLVALFMWSCGDDDPAGPTDPPPPAPPDKVTLSAVQDNTLYETAGTPGSNGAGIKLYVGKTAVPYGPSDLVPRIRRALIQFDVAGSGIPAASTIDSVCLELEVVQQPGGGSARHAFLHLHQVLNSRGESGSVAGGGGGGGGTPLLGDVTWIHRFFDAQFWSNPGGDFVATSSGNTFVDGIGVFEWRSTSRVVSDVQLWLDTPGANNGWVLADGEAATDTLTAKAFASRENQALGDKGPKLTIYYTTP